MDIVCICFVFFCFQDCIARTSIPLDGSVDSHRTN
jgi:hypothetical protein